MQQLWGCCWAWPPPRGAPWTLSSARCCSCTSQLATLPPTPSWSCPHWCRLRLCWGLVCCIRGHVTGQPSSIRSFGHLFVRLFVRLFVHSFVHVRRILHWGMIHMTVSSTLVSPVSFPWCKPWLCWGLVCCITDHATGQPSFSCLCQTCPPPGSGTYDCE